MITAETLNEYARELSTGVADPSIPFPFTREEMLPVVLEAQRLQSVSYEAEYTRLFNHFNNLDPDKMGEFLDTDLATHLEVRG